MLDPRKVNLNIKTDKVKGIFINDITERYIGSEEEVYDIMKIGNENRAVASTKMNDQSSRSHSLFLMTLTQNNQEDNSCKIGKLYLVDLAGSEKVGKTGASGQTLNEAKGINKSLSTLGKVIKALTESKKVHIPYRESKLTRLLSESLGGNAKTALIITCSPSPYNEAETISTLRFGTAARNIKNTPKVNKELTVAEMKRLIAKYDRVIKLKSYRVEILETHITTNGLEVPEDEYAAETANLGTKAIESTPPSKSDEPKEAMEEDKSEDDKSEEEEKSETVSPNNSLVMMEEEEERAEKSETELLLERERDRNSR